MNYSQYNPWKPLGLIFTAVTIAILILIGIASGLGLGIGFNNGDQNRILPITNPVTNST